MMKEKKQKIEQLIKILNEASRAYYDDAVEMMSNLEYDKMYDELELLEQETGYIPPNSPTINVGYSVKSELPKEKHPQKLLSLNKTKDRDALVTWLGDRDGLLSWKLDGLTVVLTYVDGKLSKAVTRGNGEIGEIVTDNAAMFVNIPKNIPNKSETVIRGEAVIKYSDFEKINEMIEDADAKYKNPRNLCSGSVRQLDSRVTAERRVNFFAFTLKSAAGIDFTARIEQMKWISEQGFDVVPYLFVNKENLNDIIDDFEKKIKNFDIPSDGLVLSLNDLKYSAALGQTAKFPKDAIAFKWKDQEAETVLRKIEWSPSRTGLLNPIALFDPVELEGTTVKRASVHNINIMEDLKLGIGDTITVYKANMIIPQIAKNKTESGRVSIPELCPVCGGNTKLRTEGDTKVLICTNPFCIAKQVKRFSLFVSRDALNIEGLSESTLLKLMGMGLIRSFSDIFELAKHKNEIIEMDGFGKRSYENLIKSIDVARHTNPAKILTGLGITGIGVTTSGQIASACKNSWTKIRSLTANELLEIDGIGEVTTSSYLQFFRDEASSAMLDRLTAQLDIDESYIERGETLNGKTFVITGSLMHYKSRKELKKDIEMQGGRVTGSVTGDTDFLITNDPDSGSEKNKSAIEHGTFIITENDIIKMIGNKNNAKGV